MRQFVVMRKDRLSHRIVRVHHLRTGHRQRRDVVGNRIEVLRIAGSLRRADDAATCSDGEQKRDFIYVDDAVAVVRWLLETPSVSGIFNVGTGKARSFRDLMTAVFAALGKQPNIEYVDMPEAIRDTYQYFTQAEMRNLRRAGFSANFLTLEDAVKRYVRQYLDRADRFR